MRQKTAKSVRIIFVSLLFLLNLVAFTHAEGEVNLSEFPAQLAEKLTIDLFPAQLLTCAIFLALLEGPVLLVSRKNIIPPIFVGVLALGFCIGMGWLNYWFLLVLVMLVALMFAGKMRDLITGG